jgi:transposase InsO family protein
MFDEGMRPLVFPDGRGKSMKITADMVRRIVVAARELKASGRRLRLKSFTHGLAEEHDIFLSRKKVSEILIANGLYKVRIKKRRPRFYQRLRQSIPNGLISVDGSEFTVWVDQVPYKFNLELAVDVESFYHSAFSLSETETSEEFIKVMESHVASWGCPLAVVADHDSANLSMKSKAYLERNQIEILPAGPANPKGNGSAEGAFSQMKQVIGPICLEASSARALAKSVLQKIISIYIAMRNRLARFGDKNSPLETIQTPISEKELRGQRESYKRRKDQQEDPSRKAKLDRLDWIITHHRLEMDEEIRKRAQKSILSYEIEAIAKSEEAFVKAVRRNQERRNLPYFFGILKRVQDEIDAGRYRDYCSQRYNYRQMIDQQKKREQPVNDITTMEDLVAMLESAVSSQIRSIKELSIRQAKRMAQNLKKQYRYMGALKRQISDILAERNDLSLSQRKEVLELAEQLLS